MQIVDHQTPKYRAGKKFLLTDKYWERNDYEYLALFPYNFSELLTGALIQICN